MTPMRGVAVACIVFLLAVAPAAQPTRSVPSGTASLGGRVIDRDSRRPLENAIVTLTLGLDEAELASLTDKEGEYLFEGVAAGSYRVSATLDGYVHEELGGRRFLEFEYNGRTVRIVTGSVARGLKDGQARRDVNFALVRAGSIRGRIVSAEGRPIEGARVRAVVTGPDGGFSYGEHSSARTNERGEYEIRNLLAGVYRVMFEWFDPEARKAKATPEVRPTYFPGTHNPAEALPLTLAPGANLRADIRRPTEEFFRIEGHVLRGYSDGQIEANMLMPGLAIRTVSVAEDGAFELGYLKSGRYMLYARAETPDGFEAAWTEVDLGTDLTGLLLPMNPTAEIRGRIVMSDGMPPGDGLQVAANLVAEDGSAIDPLWRDRTDVEPGGRFHLRGLFGRRKLLVLGLPPELVLERVMHGRTEVERFLLASGDSLDDVLLVINKRQ